MNIRLSGYITESIVDGPGIRSVLFTQGCPHNCPGCQNPKTHDFTKGKLCDIKEMVDILSSNMLASGITISGGEPFSQPDEVLEFIKEYKKINPNKTIFIYSGYTIEELWNKHNSSIDEILSLCDDLVDGRFVMDKLDLSLLYRGSSNQRIIDLKNTTKDNIVLSSYYYNKQ